jgi:hypothetical protein
MDRLLLLFFNSLELNHMDGRLLLFFSGLELTT